jgi:hypothetical protein
VLVSTTTMASFERNSWSELLTSGVTERPYGNCGISANLQSWAANLSNSTQNCTAAAVRLNLPQMSRDELLSPGHWRNSVPQRRSG